MTTRLRDERGSILLIAGITIPVLLMFAAISLEIGSWYVHKRALQNRADAAALAAGAAYANRFPTCSTNATLESQITNEANKFAGKPGTVGAENTTLNDQAKITVSVNASDNIAPCHPHTTGDSISPAGRYWTEVKVQESDVGGLVLGLVGVGAQSISATARVELRQVGTSTGERPFVLASASTTRCVAATFQNVGGGALTLTNSAGTWTGNQANGLSSQDGTVDLSVGCASPDTYANMAYLTLLPNPVAGQDRLTSLTLTPSGSCTNNNPYFIPFDGVACTMTVTAGVGFANGNPRTVRVRDGVSPSGQGQVMNPVVGQPGFFSASVTVSPQSGGATDGLYTIEILARSGSNGNASPIGRARVQAGTEDVQGSIADVTIATHAAAPGAALGAIGVRLRSLTVGQKMVVRGGADCENGGSPNLHNLFTNGCTAQYQLNTGGPCSATSPYDCVGGIGNGQLNSLSGGGSGSDYNTLWAPAGTCTVNHYGTYPDIPDGDPRLILVFVTDTIPAAQNASQHYPILAIGGLYVTGWENSISACNSQNEAPPAGASVAAGKVWGRYVPPPTSSGNSTPGPAGCTGAEPCVAALVR